MPTDIEIAKKFLETVPPLVRIIRSEIRCVAGKEMTVPQYRILANIQLGMCNVGTIAENHGVSQPAMSKMVEALVKRGLISREHSEKDRRQISLSLTKNGHELFLKIQKATQVHLAVEIKKLEKKEKLNLFRSMNTIDSLLAKNKIFQNHKRGRLL